MNPRTQDRVSTVAKDAFEALAGSFFVTGMDSNIFYSNGSILGRTGYSPAEAIGKKPRELWGGSMGQDFYARMWQVIREGKTPFSATMLNTQKNGEVFEEDVYIAPIVSAAGTLEGFADLHPYLGDGRSRDAFRAEFLEVFSGSQADSKEIMQWALPWLSEGRTQREEALAALGAIRQDSQDFATFVREAFVFPAQEDFPDRRADQMLVRAAQESPGAFRLLYMKYRQDITRYFLQRTDHDRTLAEELMQETFLRAFRGIKSFQVTNASYKTYLLRIAHNMLLNHFRKKPDLGLDSLPEDLLKVNTRYDSAHLHSIIWKSMGVLTLTEQQIFTHKYAQGLKVREISTIMQLSENAVKLHLSRSRKKLKNYLSP